MAEVKLTKNELRDQQHRLTQLQKYLPTLQLKKALLQNEVQEARTEIAHWEEKWHEVNASVEAYAGLLTESTSFDISKAAIIENIKRRYENIAGVEVPYFEGMTFEPFTYPLFDTPPWLDQVVVGLRGLAEADVRVWIAKEKKEALEKEWRAVSIRVNLFEKILIPRATQNIKKIKTFLGDQQLAAVAQAKVAKAKIEERKEGSEACVSM